ncbi:MAG TPA: phosphotransacetylase family protein [Anaerolineales bacterium]
MKSLYITSVERYSGKTATCLALGKKLQSDGYKVGYLKPFSLQPWRVSGHVADEDAAFVIEALGLEAQPWELSPVVVTSEALRQRLHQPQPEDLLDRVKAVAQSIGANVDMLLVEGGASLREGYIFDLSTPRVAEALGSPVLVLIKYQDPVRLMDDALTATFRLGKLLVGAIINRVPDEARQFVTQDAVPALERLGVPVFGVLPERRGLEALTVEELIEVLNPQVLAAGSDPQALVETLTVGAMTADAALSRFRRQMNKAVITGGDRTDIQLAALETSTTCLILTGNLQPSPLIVKQAEEFGVAVLLVPTNTMETIEAIEKVFGKTHLAQPSKLEHFQELVAANVDMARLYKAIGLT